MSNGSIPMGQGYDDAPADPLDIQLPGVAFEADADETEQAAEENRYLSITRPGTYRLKVVKIAKVSREKKTVYVGGRETFFDALVITVIFGDARDVRYQISDQFVFPATADRRDLEAYNRGTSRSDSTYVHAEKMGHFLNRLIGGFSKGQAIPPYARDMRNWLGRDIMAEVSISKRKPTGKNDPTTGEPTFYEPRAQVVMYSYRTASPEGGESQEAESTEPTGAPPQQAQPAPAGRQPAARGSRNI